MTGPVDDVAAKRTKAERLKKTSVLYFILGGVWFAVGIMPVVMDLATGRPVEGPNVVFMALAPVWIALGAAQRASAKKLLAEIGGAA